MGVAAKPWADASSEARSVAEYIMLVAAANTRDHTEYMVRGLMWEVQPCVERRMRGGADAEAARMRAADARRRRERAMLGSGLATKDSQVPFSVAGHSRG